MPPSVAELAGANVRPDGGEEIDLIPSGSPRGSRDAPLKRSTIHGAPMSDGIDHDLFRIVMDHLQDAIFADANTPFVAAASKLLATGRPGLAASNLIRTCALDRQISERRFAI